MIQSDPMFGMDDSIFCRDCFVAIVLFGRISVLYPEDLMGRWIFQQLTRAVVELRTVAETSKGLSKMNLHSSVLFEVLSKTSQRF
jgi:hypothetical protein